MKGRGVATALASILPRLDAGATALALDFKKCFDFTHPVLALQHFKLHQWPAELVGLLSAPRAREFLVPSALQCRPHEPDGSAPGPFYAVRDISRHHTQSVFLDDRVLVADTVREVLAAKQKWARWSRKLGLEENDQKVVAWPI